MYVADLAAFTGVIRALDGNNGSHPFQDLSIAKTILAAREGGKQEKKEKKNVKRMKRSGQIVSVCAGRSIDITISQVRHARAPMFRSEFSLMFMTQTNLYWKVSW